MIIVPPNAYLESGAVLILFMFLKNIFSEGKVLKVSLLRPFSTDIPDPFSFSNVSDVDAHRVLLPSNCFHSLSTKIEQNDIMEIELIVERTSALQYPGSDNKYSRTCTSRTQ